MSAPRAGKIVLAMALVTAALVVTAATPAVFDHHAAGISATSEWIGWVSGAAATAAAIGALALGTALIVEKRRLTTAFDRLRAVADELRIARDAANAASEAKSHFLATMSHELRTPLNAVIGFSEIIAAETFGPVGQQVYRGYAADILQSGQHMLDLINDILTMAKIDAGRYELDPAPLDLRDATERAVHMFRGSKVAEGRRITIGADAKWPWLEVDERALRQMLLNLLSNAAKFSEPDTAIDLICDTDGEGDIVVTVVDRGIGMTEVEAAQVVLPFHQADSRLARKYEGSGLGLSIVAGLMSYHGGRLAIVTEPEVGSRISLVFPASAVCSDCVETVAA
jgi:signal transduction histidine kinase